MDKLKELYNKFDIENTGSIDHVRIKKILNLLNIKDFTDINSNKTYTYQDLCEIIMNKYCQFQNQTTVHKLREFLDCYYSEKTVNFIIKDVYGENIDDSDTIDLDKIINYSKKID